VLAYVVRRIAWAIVLVFTVTAITFVIFFTIPTERTRALRTQDRGVVDVRQAVGVHGPVYRQYGQFVWHLAHGQMGRSFRTRQSVNQMLADSAPVTASLVFGGAVVWLLMAVPLGILSAVRPRSLIDRFATVFILLGVSLHPVWIGLAFGYIFGYRLHLFPIQGYCEVTSPPPGAICGGIVQWAWHLVLPWFTFAFLFAALYVRMIRASVSEAMHEDYVRTARAKGASEFRVLRTHALRNAVLPVISMLGMDVGVALGGALFVEQVYGLPGIGRLALRALRGFDLPIILGVIVVLTVSIVIFNLIVDLVYGMLDPRVRLAGGVEARDRVVKRAGKTAPAQPATSPTPST
jgi:peptide/nickel transport system permease protein